MHERPDGISEPGLAAALREHWGFTVADLSYAPVGFGGYHWLAAGGSAERWFVTVSDLDAYRWLSPTRRLVISRRPWASQPRSRPTLGWILSSPPFRQSREGR